jgi:hypothetical protein
MAERASLALVSAALKAKVSGALIPVPRGELLSVKIGRDGQSTWHVHVYDDFIAAVGKAKGQRGNGGVYQLKVTSGRLVDALPLYVSPRAATTQGCQGYAAPKYVWCPSGGAEELAAKYESALELDNQARGCARTVPLGSRTATLAAQVCIDAIINIHNKFTYVPRTPAASEVSDKRGRYEVSPGAKKAAVDAAEKAIKAAEALARGSTAVAARTPKRSPGVSSPSASTRARRRAASPY